jgi:hypothetical protein
VAALAAGAQVELVAVGPVLETTAQAAQARRILAAAVGVVATQVIPVEPVVRVDQVS